MILSVESAVHGPAGGENWFTCCQAWLGRGEQHWRKLAEFSVSFTQQMIGKTPLICFTSKHKKKKFNDVNSVNRKKSEDVYTQPPNTVSKQPRNPGRTVALIEWLLMGCSSKTTAVNWNFKCTLVPQKRKLWLYYGFEALVWLSPWVCDTQSNEREPDVTEGKSLFGAPCVLGSFNFPSSDAIAVFLSSPLFI